MPAVRVGVVIVVRLAHLLQADGRRGAVDDLVLWLSGRGGRDAHRRGLLCLYGGVAAAADATAPNDEANDEDYEDEAADEDVGPATQYPFFVPRERR